MTAEKSRSCWKFQEGVAETALTEVVLKILVLKIIGKSQQNLNGGGALGDKPVCLSKATSNTHQTDTCSNSTIERLEKGVKYVQS